MTLKGWKELPIGAVVDTPGNISVVETGSWAVEQPVVDLDACVHCMICWMLCPDSAFIVEGDKLMAVDYVHCKGCGICAVECPKKCIEMVQDLQTRKS